MNKPKATAGSEDTNDRKPDDVSHSSRAILVVDDEPTMRDLIVSLIRRSFDYHVASACNGDEALVALADGAFDAVITDMLMPGRHGVELVREMREKFPEVDVIAITGYEEAFPFLEIIEAGACDFISKPFKKGEIEAKVQRVLRERILREALTIAETKYRNLFDYSMNGLVLLQPETFRIIDVNESFCAMCARKREHIVWKRFQELLDPNAWNRFESGMKVISKQGRGTLSDLSILDADDHELRLDVSITFIEVPRETIILLSFKDVTVQRELEQELVDVANTDALTGLSNRRAFRTRLEWAIGAARRSEKPMTLLMLDIDNFKHCNDTYGHQAGDEVLAMVGDLVRESIRAEGDEGFRFGGDEFAVMLPGANTTVARRIAERIRKAFLERQRYGTSLSSGIADYSAEMDAEALVQSADEALYRAKSAGKNTICVTQPGEFLPPQ